LIRWALRKALVALGCEVREAADAGSAVRAVSEPDEHFDVVLLDFKLPDSDGLDLLTLIKSRQPQAPVLLMTAFGTEETKAEAIARGARCVIAKPFDVKALAAMIVEKHQAEAAR
jgi:DNA-binding NtrC family response regulator